MTTPQAIHRVIYGGSCGASNDFQFYFYDMDFHVGGVIIFIKFLINSIKISLYPFLDINMLVSSDAQKSRELG